MGVEEGKGVDATNAAALGVAELRQTTTSRIISIRHAYQRFTRHQTINLLRIRNPTIKLKITTLAIIVTSIGYSVEDTYGRRVSDV